MQFIISEQANLIPFKKPDELWITINDTDGLYFNERNEKDADLFHFLTELQKHTAHQTAIEGTLNTLLLALFINFMYNERKFSPNIQSKHQLRITKDESIRDFVINFFSGLSKTDLYLDNRKMSYGKYRELSTKIPAFIAFTESLMQRGVLLADTNKSNHYLKLNQNSDADLKAFMNYYLEIKGISTF